MKFEVYCDETLPDLFTSAQPGARFLMIGSLWLPADLRDDVKDRIARLRQQHGVHGEMKWRKVSPSKVGFYTDLIDLFMSFGLDLRFRCIAVEHQAMNLGLHNGDAELGFYKFYYQLLHHWILDFNESRIFCYLKTNRDRKRLHDLQRCLHYSNLSATITDIQSLPSPEVVLLQLCDVLLGAASSRLNGTLGQGTAKEAVVRKLEERLNIHGRIGPTRRTEEKFNVFRIRLDGGW